MIRRPGWILSLLTLLNLLNYVDRFLVSALSPGVQADLALTDAQTGAVLSAFMVGYFLSSPLFGWVGDRSPRKFWMAGGVLVWSLGTLLSGKASSLAALLAARVLVGVGEASFGALSPALIDDLAPRDKRSRWQGVFFAAIPLGAALGFLLGGWLGLEFGWRRAFGLAGLPGLALGLLVLGIAEPPRVEAKTPVQAGRRGWDLPRSPAYRWAVAGYAAQTFALGGFTAWAAPYLVRRYRLDLHRADFLFGLVTVGTGVLGTLFGGWWSDRASGVDRVQSGLRLCAQTSLVAAPLALLALLSTAPTGFFVALGAAELAIFVSVAPINVALLQSVPPWQRTGAMALSIFGMHLFGDLPSPTLVGWLSDHLSHPSAGAGHGLQRALGVLPLALAVSSWVWFRAGRLGSETQGPLPRPAGEG